MPGAHTAKQKRQAKHIAESEKKRGMSAKDAESVGWATVNKYKKAAVSKQMRKNSLASVQSQLNSASSVVSRPKPGKAPSSLAHVQRQLNSASSVVGKKSSKKPSMKKDVGAGGGFDGGSAYASMGKAMPIISLDDAYRAMKKGQLRKDEGGPTSAGPAPGVGPAKKFPRKPKPTVQLAPVGKTPKGHPMRAISDAEAMANLRSGKHYEKSMKWLMALKALATGYSKISGGGALKAPNRGYMSIEELTRAMVKMPPPTPAGAGKKPVYLPGVHPTNSALRTKPPRSAAGSSSSSSSSGMGSGKAMKKPKLKKTYPTITASMTHSSKAPGVLEEGGATELSNSVRNVVHKSEGATTMGKTDFNDLFKSELGTPADEVLCACPHCEEPITKSDLAKARGHKGKGKETHQTGAKHGKSSAHVRDQNPEGGTMRGGEGRGVLSPSRGVPGAKKTDEVQGIQNSKGSARKSVDPMADVPVVEGDEDSDQVQQQVAKSEKPSIKIRGTEFVQYVENPFADGDAAIAKSIAEGMGGTPPTQPLDMNNDLTRLLV